MEAENDVLINNACTHQASLSAPLRSDTDSLRKSFLSKRQTDQRTALNMQWGQVPNSML